MRCHTAAMIRETAHLDGMTAVPGDHVCVFYRGTAERRRLLADFLGEGVDAGASCLAIAGDEDRDWLSETLGDAADLTVESYTATYTRGGTFDRSHMLDYWRRWGSGVRPGARTASDMSWAEHAFTPPVLDEFMAYEAESTTYARDLSVIALCLYDLDRLGGQVIIPALRAHPAVLVRGVLVRNPYCETPN